MVESTVWTVVGDEDDLRRYQSHATAFRCWSFIGHKGGKT